MQLAYNPHSGYAYALFARSWVMRKFWIACILAMVLAGCKTKVQEQEQEPVRPARVVKVVLGTFVSKANYSGEVRARYETALAFRVGGKIAKRLVDVGSVVKQGQVLAELDTADLRLAESANRSEVAAAEADYWLAKRNLARYEDMLAKKFISPTEYERHKNQYDTAHARLNQVRMQVVAAAQPVMHLAQLQEKDVVVSVPENRLADLKAAGEIQISLWAEPGKFYHGKVREISPSADPVTRTYTVKVTVTDNAEAMQLGMTANVLLGGELSQRAVELPLTALYQQNGKQAVWLVDAASGKVRLAPIQVGEYRETTFTVLAGLNNGDLVVSAGVHKLVPNQRVRIVTENAQ
jgi:multidrug efflux pump subunit AcrA (membrane-fusion protein)